MTYTVGDLLAEFLAASGVTTAFGIVSVHNVPLLDAIGRRNTIRFVPVRGEMGGGHMADAYARVSGGLGVLITSTGPGAANAVPALAEASFAGSPVLHITGQTATAFIGRDAGGVHDLPGQRAMLEAVCKSVYRPVAPEQVFGLLLAAVTDALSARQGPVTVELPTDLQRQAVTRPPALDRLEVRRRVALPLEAELDAAAEMLAGSRRPMLWLGNGAKAAGAEALALLDLGFGAVSSWNGRGIVPEDHPRTLGGLHGNGAPEIEAFYDTVDVMLVVASRLRGHETHDGALRLPRRRVQVDLDPSANGRSYKSELFVQGDAALVLAGLAQRLAGRIAVDPGFGDDLADARSRAAEAYRVSLGPYADFPAQLRHAMPRDAIWVRDATVAASTWGHRLMPVYGASNSVYPVGRRDRSRPAVRRRRRAGGGAARPQDGGARRRRRVCGEHDGTLDRRAGAGRSLHHRHERRHLRGDRPHPGRVPGRPPLLRRAARPGPRGLGRAGGDAVLAGGPVRPVRRLRRPRACRSGSGAGRGRHARHRPGACVWPLRAQVTFGVWLRQYLSQNFGYRPCADIQISRQIDGCWPIPEWQLRCSVTGISAIRPSEI